MRLSEPTTAVTDFFLAIELLLLGSLLAGSSSQVSVSLWAASFLVMAVAAIAGGTFHAGRFTFDSPSLRALWNSVRIGIAVSFGLLLAAGAVSTFGVLRSILLPAGVLVAFMRPRRLFPPSGRGRNKAIRIVAILLLALTVVSLIQLRDNQSSAGIWILSGGVITSAAIAIQRARVTFHPQFNHNDLFHVIMMAAYYFLYRGGLLLRD